MKFSLLVALTAISLYRLGLEKCCLVEIKVTAGALADLYGLEGELLRLRGRVEVTEC